MIPVPRTLGVPDALTRRSTRAPKLNETEKVLAAADRLLADAGLDPGAAAHDEIVATLAALDFDFTKYRHTDVKAALTSLFHGKCAYCESTYAGTQPMDVEHYRPKAQVLDDGTEQPLKPGYYWLAASWGNLLPSCIDCNRRRRHGEHLTAGKADHFPLAPGSPRIRWHGDDPDGDGDGEQPLLLNPCVDGDIDAHLRFTIDGEVVGLTERGVATIEVYGLMRPGLVIDRRHVARVVEFRLDLVQRLVGIRRQLTPPGDDVDRQVLTLVEEVITLLLRELEAMTADDRPFAGMVRQLLAAHLPAVDADDLDIDLDIAFDLTASGGTPR